MEGRKVVKPHKATEGFRPVRSAEFVWSQERCGIVVKVPWQKAGFTFRHFRILSLGEVMFTLKSSAGEIWKCCDGTRSIEQVLQEVKARFPDAYELRLKQTIGWLIHKGWLLKWKGGKR